MNPTNGQTPGEPLGHPVGIDLGTTTSIIAYVDDAGQVQTLRNAEGELLTPSAVFIEDDVIVGKAAVELGATDVDRYAESFKRQMGKPHFHRKLRGYRVPPEVLSAFVLERLKQDAQRIVGPVRDVVISVPAYFDERRRKITQEAGRLAGLNVLDIVNEPTAAAIAYGYEQHMLGDGSAETPAQRLLVYDLGGGTFDISVLQFKGRKFTTLATDGDVELGGNDFDLQLMNFLAEEFLKRHGVDPRVDSQSMHRLWSTARETKHALTDRQSHVAACKHAGLFMSIEVTRPTFESLIEPLVERTLSTCSDVLDQAKLRWSDIDQILLVGGSSRIPMIAGKLERLAGKAPALSDRPDELVAQGAALYASTRVGGNANFDVVNVNAHSLGIAGFDPATNQPINKVLIARNTPLPATASHPCITRKDNQPSVAVNLVEGESENPRFCIPLGKCVVQLEPNLPMGTAVEVICHYDLNGTISVAARVPRTRRSAFVEIRRESANVLEPLSIWRRRLARGEEPAAAPAPTVGEPQRPTNLADPSQVVERLDFLYSRVGNQSASLTVPFSALPSQRALHSVRQEISFSRQLLSAVETRMAKALDRHERMQLGGVQSRAKDYLRQAEALATHTEVVLGRECLAVHFCPPEGEGHLAEIRTLEAALQPTLE